MTRLRARIEIGVELEIVQTGNLVLRQQARPLGLAEITSKEIQKLIESMRKTMHDAPGVGLAAPQVGLSLQIAVIEDREDYHKDVSAEQLQKRERRPVPFHAIVNPRIVETSGETAEFFDCSDLPFENRAQLSQEFLGRQALTSHHLSDVLIRTTQACGC